VVRSHSDYGLKAGFRHPGPDSKDAKFALVSGLSGRLAFGADRFFDHSNACRLGRFPSSSTTNHRCSTPWPGCPSLFPVVMRGTVPAFLRPCALAAF